MIVLDTCDNPLYTAEQSVDLLQGFMYRKVKNIHKDVVCSNDTVKNILGIIGAQTSEVSLEIARLGRIFHVPQVELVRVAQLNNHAPGQLPINSAASVADDKFLKAGNEMLNNAYAMAQFYDRDAPAEMASEGMKGFQEYMVKPERRAKILERLEKIRQRVYK